MDLLSSLVKDGYCIDFSGNTKFASHCEACPACPERSRRKRRLRQRGLSLAEGTSEGSNLPLTEQEIAALRY